MPDAAPQNARLPTQHRVQPHRHLPLSLLEHMPVCVRRQHDRAVPQQVLDILKREALHQQECRSGMPEVMEPTVGESGRLQRPPERARDRGRIERRAAARREDVARSHPR